MRNSALVLSWLRLVQAARNGEEQNTEAFLKAGQLYVRTIRDIRPEEELLVWYDQELSHLLGFTDMTRGLNEGEAKIAKYGHVPAQHHEYYHVGSITIFESYFSLKHTLVIYITHSNIE